MASKSAKQALCTALTYTSHTKARRFTRPLSVARKTTMAREILRQVGLVTK